MDGGVLEREGFFIRRERKIQKEFRTVMEWEIGNRKKSQMGEKNQDSHAQIIPRNTTTTGEFTAGAQEHRNKNRGAGYQAFVRPA